MLYYAPTTENTSVQPKTLNAYQLLSSGSSGPVPSTYASSYNSKSGPVRFCVYSPTPVGSWNSAAGDPTTGIVWAIEHQNTDNPTDCLISGDSPHAALHAFAAVPNGTALTELYNSGTTSANRYIGGWNTFSTPTIFNTRVYMGTQTEVDVFGVCNGACMQ
jgi:hypothetical protein